MKRTYLFVLVALFLCSANADAQEVCKFVIGPVVVSENNQGLSYTAGESLIGSVNSMDLYVGLGFQNCTGIQFLTNVYEHSSELEISIYPNPAIYQRLYINIGNLNASSSPLLDMHFELFDAHGRKLLDGALANGLSSEIDLPHQLSTGVYALKVFSGNELISSHMVNYISP